MTLTALAIMKLAELLLQMNTSLITQIGKRRRQRQNHTSETLADDHFLF